MVDTLLVSSTFHSHDEESIMKFKTIGSWSTLMLCYAVPHFASGISIRFIPYLTEYTLSSSVAPAVTRSSRAGISERHKVPYGQDCKCAHCKKG